MEHKDQIRKHKDKFVSLYDQMSLFHTK
jgi:hypothetical protein